MTTYLFVTSPDYNPERVGIDELWWSCSKSAKDGDTALVYVTGQGVMYEWDLVSDAEPCPEWRFRCDVRYAREFDPPITLKEIRETFTADEWPAATTNFRGLKSIRLAEQVASRLRAMRSGGLSVVG